MTVGKSCTVIIDITIEKCGLKVVGKNLQVVRNQTDDFWNERKNYLYYMTRLRRAFSASVIRHSTQNKKRFFKIIAICILGNRMFERFQPTFAQKSPNLITIKWRLNRANYLIYILFYYLLITTYYFWRFLTARRPTRGLDDNNVHITYSYSPKKACIYIVKSRYYAKCEQVIA